MEDIKSMTKEELLDYLESISKQLDNIALDQIGIAIEELQFLLENSIPKSELKKDLEHMKNAKATGVKQLLMKKGVIGYLEKLLS